MYPEIVDNLEMVELAPARRGGERLEDASATGAAPGAGVLGGGRSLRDDVLIFTIHDGDKVPRHLFGERSEEIVARPEVATAYALERDWGANLVARQLARELGLDSFLKLNLARVVMDFGRFPGTSSEGEAYLLRHALFAPLTDFLSEEAKHEVLARYYDATSHAIVQHFADKRATISIHTYDAHNRTGTERPAVSLVERSLEYQQFSTIPPNVFDPLFPPILCESTSHRLLTYQLLLAFERGGWRTALNYPYVMPLGSVEIRAQVWFFFRHVRERFTRVFPHTRDEPAYQRVWQLLLDVVRRSHDAERLRGFLHRYREAPAGSEKLFAEARQAYGEIGRFLADHQGELVETYRFSPRRPSCLGIEIRKDLLCRMDAGAAGLDTVTLRPDAEQVATEVARCIAGAVRAYVTECFPAEPRDEPGVESLVYGLPLGGVSTS